VAVIGGGAAGLRALAGLYTSAPRISAVLLEASAELGGRLRRVPDSFVPGVALDAGGEVVHGSTTELNRLAAAAGVRLDFMFTCAQGDGGPDDAPVNGMSDFAIDGLFSIVSQCLIRHCYCFSDF
jgi:thioredoxin reductase